MSNGFCKNRGYVVFYCYISSNSVLFLMFWTFVAFNTSHVKVNLLGRYTDELPDEFQYIPC